MAHDLTLWGAGTARTMRAHWMLLELGLEYEFHPLHARTGETQTDEFKRLNPRHKIPVLRHGSFVLTESAAIIQYLSETFTNSAYLFGDRLSTADILLMTCLDWAASIEIPLSETVSHYRLRLGQRTAYRAALKRNFAR
jgi:glutathione S-transferase